MEMNIGIAECGTFTKVARPAKFSMLPFQVGILSTIMSTNGYPHCVQACRLREEHLSSDRGKEQSYSWKSPGRRQVRPWSTGWVSPGTCPGWSEAWSVVTPSKSQMYPECFSDQKIPLKRTMRSSASDAWNLMALWPRCSAKQISAFSTSMTITKLSGDNVTLAQTSRMADLPTSPSI